MKPAATARSAAATLDDHPVLPTASLRPGFDRRDLSRYGDASWDLGPAVFRENARRCHVTVHFGAVPDPTVAQRLREYLYARLNVEIPGFRSRLPPASVRQAFNRARRFFEFVGAELGCCDLDRVDQALLDRYAKLLRNGRCRPVVVAQLLDTIFDLHAYRAHLPNAALPFEPWPGRSPSQVAGYRYAAEENRTPRMPEAVIAALLHWSLKYVTLFSRDIFAAREELLKLEGRQRALAAADAVLPPDQRRARRRARLTEFFDDRRRLGRGVPIWTTAHNGVVRRDPVTGTVTPPVNWLLLHQHAGVDAQAEPGTHLQLATGAPDLVAAAIDAIGAETGGMDTPITIDPDLGRPWGPRFDARTLAHEERMLQAACYVVCAYLTGMRDCEVQAMRAGCLSLSRSADGIIDRHRIRSIAYKGKTSQGEAAEWVTIEPVAEAIRVLGAALGARGRCARFRHALAGAGPQDGNEGASLSRDRPSAQCLSRPSQRAVRDRRPSRHSARSNWRAVAHHDTTVPPHHRLAYRQSSLRNDRRHDPVQACLCRCVRRLCWFKQIRLPLGGRKRTPPRPARRLADLFR